MDRETIIKLANETLDRMAPDDYCRAPYWTATDDELERFANLVAEHEREACAKFCETHQVWVGRGKRGFSEWGEDDFVTGGIHQGMDYAAAIRARSK